MPDAKQDQAAQPSDDDIRNKAYDLWIAEGQPDGKHEEHWHRARHSLAPSDADQIAGSTPVDLEPAKADPAKPSAEVTPMRKGRKSAAA